MKDRIFFLNQGDIYLYPGEVYVSNRDIKIITLLGTCVSIVLHDRRKKVGAIIHGMLPTRSSNSDNLFEKDMTKYIDYSYSIVIKRMVSLGAEKERITAKLFGGACLFKGSESHCIGTQNAEFALQLIDKEGIKLTSTDLGGELARKIVFFPRTGEVFLKYLENTNLINRVYELENKIRIKGIV